MRQTHQNPDESNLRHGVTMAPRADNTTHVEALSDRQAVIAVMTSGGLTCDEIALVLPIPIRTIEDDLQRAMSILGLSDTKDLTHLVVATHYDRVRPTSRFLKHRVEDAAHLTDKTRDSDAPTLGEFSQASRGVDTDVLAAVNTSSHTGGSANSLVLLDAIEAAQAHTQELGDPHGPGSGSVGIGRPR